MLTVRYGWISWTRNALLVLFIILAAFSVFPSIGACDTYADVAAYLEHPLPAGCTYWQQESTVSSLTTVTVGQRCDASGLSAASCGCANSNGCWVNVYCDGGIVTEGGGNCVSDCMNPNKGGGYCYSNANNYLVSVVPTCPTCTPHDKSLQTFMICNPEDDSCCGRKDQCCPACNADDCGGQK
jgi:hypothetical protein